MGKLIDNLEYVVNDIAKNIELVNNQINDRIAYSKYNVTPDKYERMVNVP